MQTWRTETKACLFGSALLFCSSLISIQAQANPTQQNDASPLVSPRAIGPKYANGHQLFPYVHGKRGSTRSYAISCVPYARQVSGIDVVGDAWTWWKKAAGEYARGDRPEAGSVLTFRANGRMHLGHVAVVKQIVNPREVIVDHANWSNGGGHGEVSHNVVVVDVSEANNWSAVRVQLANRRDFGSVYPTYGFIYNRPDDGAVTISVDRPAPQPDINPVPSDLRPVAERPWHTVEEVAEAPDAKPRQIDLRVSRETALGQ